MHDPAKSRSWKAEARAAIVNALDAQDLAIAFPDGACVVSVLAVFSCPKSDFRKVPRPRRPHAKRPDAENVAKAVLDAGTGALWRDDAQVSRLTVEKQIGAQGERPYVQIEVSPWS